MKTDRINLFISMKTPWVLLAGFLIAIQVIFRGAAFSQDETQSSSMPALKKAGLFEDIKDGVPVNQGLVFSSGLGGMICYTEFDPVPEKTFIYHKYYFRDDLSSRIKLTLNPPRWATYSRIQLRETDKGPWRVEITDETNKVLHVIRFSITD